ncbi:MAG: hypothetical protein QOG63_153 [Thermoleophilaceae bacterium]|nr:hypothetical protein [Thermoleophilaceae bacterium]
MNATISTTYGGELLPFGTPEHDAAARDLHNAMFHDRRPAAIARPASVAEVAQAIRLARSSRLPIAVRGGGHHAAGHATNDGGLVIDMGRLRGVAVDPVARVARVEGGARWGDVDAATQRFGLATTGGRVSTTGVVGQALGSGSGWLERKHGWSGDNVTAVELVTADGELVRASATSEPELFWGLRGAAPNFGVVTALEIALHPLGPVVTGGMLLYDGAEAAALVRALRDVLDAAPDELGVAMVLLTAPPEPFVPEGLRGRPAVGIAGCFAGDVADGARAFEPLRALGPAVDMVEPMPYTAVQQLLDPITGAGMRQYWKSEALPELTDAAIDAVAAAGTHPSSPFTQLVIEPKGRAIARLPDDATALGGRGAGWLYVATSIWERPEDDAAGIGWARATAAALAPHTMAGGSLNFTSDTGGDRPRLTFGEAKYERLVALKDRFDPENVFASNANIRPSAMIGA